MNILLSVLLSPIVFLIIYDVVFSYVPWLLGRAQLPVEFVFFMVAMNVFLFFSLAWFLPFVRNRLRADLYFDSRRRGLDGFAYIALLIASALFFLILVNHVFQSFNILNVYYNNQMFYTFSRRGMSWVFFFLNAFAFVMLYDFYLHGFTKLKVISFLILIVINSAGGSRGNIITYFLCFILIYGVVWRGRRVLLLGLFIACFILATFLYNTLLRSGSDSIVDYIESRSISMDFDQASATNDAIEYWSEQGGCYTCFAEDLSNFFIPRYFYPDKPMSNAETRLVYPDVATTGSTWTFGIYGSSVINIGVLAFAFVPIFYFFYSYLYFAALTSARKSFFNFSMIYFGANAIQFVRGGVIDVRLIRLLVTLALAYFLYIVLRYSFSLHRARKVRWSSTSQETIEFLQRLE